ncbi:hypothetical protein [Micromonospora sp. NPDC050495]|uniref:phage baseplate protein n=1 Tax=Micromonospora sp. NPDC050495 TaxID=3154936 RepID=UPI0033DFDEC7
MEHLINRRTLLRAAGVGAAGAAFGAAAARPALASVPASRRFNLSDPSDKLIREKRLHNVTVLQSLAFDNVNKRIYTVQVVQGGVQLPGESAPVPGATRVANGDLCVTQLDLAGNKITFMYLKGFGHGVGMGVEPVGSTAYLWTETDAVDQWGTAITRFKFTPGAVFTTSTSGLEKHRPVSGSTNNTCVIDPTTNRLILRHKVSSGFRYNVYNLADVRARTYTPLASVAQPTTVGSARPFQGYTALGSYLYMLEGSGYGTYDSVEGTGNTYITVVDLNTGAQVDRGLTKAGYTLPFREPEGMAIQLPTGDASSARLCFGFAGGDSGARTASVYYKDLLV